MTIAKRRGMTRAIVALARRLVVIMHRIWVDVTAECPFCVRSGTRTLTQKRVIQSKRQRRRATAAEF